MNAPYVKEFAQVLSYNFPEETREIAKEEKTPKPAIATILEMQKKLLQSWEGTRVVENGNVIGKNIKGKNTPLFWCFQSQQEFNILSSHLGKTQPLYAMRSGHLLFLNDDHLSVQLANEYTREIVIIQP